MCCKISLTDQELLSHLQTKIFLASLSLYTRSEYPIRRLRIISRLMSLEPSHHREISETLATELLEINTVRVEGTKDDGLRGYLTHFQTFITTLIELQRERIDFEVLKQCLVTWSAIRERCCDLAAVGREVDDLNCLLAHLELIADYMDMRGHDTIRVAALRLIKDFNQLQSIDCNPDSLVLSFTRLGTQWLQLGYSSKAGLALDQAQGYSHQKGVISETLLQLHLSYSEYLLTIGNFDKRSTSLLSIAVNVLTYS